MTPTTPWEPRRGDDERPPFADLLEGLDDEAPWPDDELQDDASLRKALRAHSPRRRRRLEERRVKPAIALNMTPMIDVVFQLLVYFLVATSFVLREELYRVDLPRRTTTEATEATAAAATAAPVGDPFELDLEPIRVLVTTTATDPQSCRLEIVGVDAPLATFDDLRLALRERLADPSLRSGMFVADHPVVLEPSPATSWEHAVEAFNAAVLAGYVNVIFQTLE